MGGLFLFNRNLDKFSIFHSFIISFIIFAIPFLLVQGYFWELTECIISRNWDIKASNIYNGKIKNVFNVELPEINTLRFIWRGIASIVATTLMFLPFGLMIFSGALAVGISDLPRESFIFLYLFIISFIPALLWNYASTNSVFAVWNIRKAIYLMGNYTGKYILNIILFILFYTIDYALLFLASILLGLNINSTDITSTKIVLFIIWVTFAYVKYFYSLYVYAYLLGTIAPPHEA